MEQFQHLLVKQNEPHFANKQVITLYKDIKKKIKQLEKVQQTKDKKELKRYLTTFSKIIEQISKDVKSAKQRYQNIDKQKLIDDRLNQIASNIKMFREQAKIINQQIRNTEQKLHQITLNNNISEFENQSLKIALQNKNSSKRLCKSFYMTEQRDKKRQNSLVLLDSEDKIKAKAELSEQWKTLSTFHNSKNGKTPSKRSNFRQRKYNKIWGYSSNFSNEYSQKLS